MSNRPAELRPLSQVFEQLGQHRNTLEKIVESHPMTVEEKEKEKGGFNSSELVLNAILVDVECIISKLADPVWNEAGYRRIGRSVLGLLKLVNLTGVTAGEEELRILFSLNDLLHGYVHTLSNQVHEQEAAAKAISQLMEKLGEAVSDEDPFAKPGGNSGPKGLLN
jgi:hypothetical protein